jgi:hypothetical protein
LHPQVAQLEADLGSNAQVLRVSVATATGRILMHDNGINEIPAFIVLSANNTETWRGTSVPKLSDVL